MTDQPLTRLQVKVTANSHRPGLVGLIGKVLHLKVSEPPMDGRANKELCRTLAELLGIASSMVSVRYGHLARVKVVDIVGVDEERAFAILRQQIGRLTRE